MRAAGPILLLATGAVAACSVLYGPSSEEFTGGSKEAGASSTGGTSGGTSGTVGGPDSGQGGEAGAEGGAPFACPNPAILCDDFETGASAIFAPAGNPAGSKIVEGGHDSGRALSVTFQNGNEASYQAKLEGNAHVEMAFWFRLDGPPPGGPELHFRIASLLFGDPCDWELSWQIFLADDGLHQGADVYDEDLNPSCGPVKFTGKDLLSAAEVFDNRWHHIVIDADASKRIRRTSVVVDGRAPVVEAIDSESEKVPAPLQVDIGIPCVQENSGCYPWEGPAYTVYFDQVTMTAK